MSKSSRPVISGRKGVIAAGHFLASAAGTKMLALGGNAVDAGVAAGFALTVLKPTENSMGGECPMLIYSPKDMKVFSISGQGVSPKKATPQWFSDNGIDMIPGDGYLGATVPGLFGAYCTALSRFGRLSLAEVLGPAIELAEEGYPVYERMSATIASLSKRFTEEWPSSAAIFMPGGKPPAAGQILKQPALAKTFRRILDAAGAGGGREDSIARGMNYYYDEIADDILEFTKSFPVRDASGKKHVPLLEKEDFTGYATRVEEPVYTQYRNYEVFKCGTWTQGPVFLQQLKLLEGYALGDMRHNSAEYMHIVVECAKLAFDDREKYYGDPLFSDIPMDMLLSEPYNQKRRQGIDPAKANNDKLWEENIRLNDCGCDCDTTHLDVMDSEGFMMSATPSGGWIPSSPVIPKVGFALGTRGQMFVLDEGHPNVIAPGKRPRATLTPTLAFKDGTPLMVFGTPGGDCQDQWALQFFLNIADYNMDLQQAIDKPSFHTFHFKNSFYPKEAVIGKVFIEKDACLDEMMKLQNMGHILNLLEPASNGQVCAVQRNRSTGAIEGAASAKGDGQAYAMGW